MRFYSGNSCNYSPVRFKNELKFDSEKHFQEFLELVYHVKFYGIVTFYCMTVSAKFSDRSFGKFWHHKKSSKHIKFSDF